MSIRVLVVSDVPLYREGVARALAEACTIDVVGTAPGAEQGSESARQLVPDVVLMDMAIPGAFDAARDIAHTLAKTRVVALAMPETESHVIACAEVGVAGYVPRDGSVTEAVDVIEAVARGEAHCSPRIVGSLLRRIAALAAAKVGNGNGNGVKGSLGCLTARETEIFALLQQGLPNKLISRQLGIELATVKNHVHSVFSKLGVHRRAEAAVLELMDDPHDAPDPSSPATATPNGDELEPVH